MVSRGAIIAWDVARHYGRYSRGSTTVPVQAVEIPRASNTLSVDNIVWVSYGHGRSLDFGCSDRIVIRVEDLGLLLIEILAWVGGLVLEGLDEAVQSNSKASSEGRTKPVDPVFVGKAAEGNTWTERSSWIQRSTGEVNTCRLSESHLMME